MPAVKHRPIEGACEIRGGVTCRDGWRDVTQFRALRKAAPVS